MEIRNNSIRDKIRELAKLNSKTVSIMCLVREISDDFKFVTVEPILSNDFDVNKPIIDNFIYDVIITPASTDNISTSYSYIPALKSYIILSWAENEDRYITTFSHLSEIKIINVDKDFKQINNISLNKNGIILEDNNKNKITFEKNNMLIDSSLIKFNGGSSELVLIEKLITRINNLEKDNNDLKTIFKNWIPVLQDGGGKLKLDAAIWFSTNLTLTKKADIANPKILQ